MSLDGFMSIKKDDEEEGMELQTIHNQDKSVVHTAIEQTAAIPMPKRLGSKPIAKSEVEATISSSPPIDIAASSYLPSGGALRVQALRADDDAIVGSPPGVHDNRRKASFVTKKY